MKRPKRWSIMHFEASLPDSKRASGTGKNQPKSKGAASLSKQLTSSLKVNDASTAAGLATAPQGVNDLRDVHARHV
jgi:hypothetical protein